MKDQNASNHARFVTGFHVITFFIILAALIISIILLVHNGVSHESVMYLLICAGLGLLFYYIRSFSTGNQDRIIRAEENFRSFRLTGSTLDPRLTRSQIIAIRFCDDEEYKELTAQAIAGNMSSKDIKAAITKWRADHHRV